MHLINKSGKWVMSRHLNAIQSDGDSCGIYVICFIREILLDIQNPNYIQTVDVPKMRKTIKQMLLDNSDSVLVHCYKCGEPLYEEMDLGKCNNCDRHLCLKCISLSDRIEEVRCPLCDENICCGCKSVVLNNKCRCCNRTICEICICICLLEDLY